MSQSAVVQKGQFSEWMLAELAKEPNRSDVKSRDVYFTRKKETAYYLDGDVVVRELNRIFGPDNWSFVIDKTTDYEAADRKDSNTGELHRQRVFYAEGTLRIFHQGLLVIERSGAGTNTAENDASGTLEKASKGAVTNALRRVTQNIGPIFGMNLNSRPASGRRNRGQQNPGQRQSNQQEQNRPAPVSAAQRTNGNAHSAERPVKPNPTANNGHSSGEIPFDPNPPGTMSPAEAAGVAGDMPAPSADLPTDFQHVGDLMAWANESCGISSPMTVVQIARESGIIELVEISGAGELQEFVQNPRLLAAIVKHRRVA